MMIKVKDLTPGDMFKTFCFSCRPVHTISSDDGTDGRACEIVLYAEPCPTEQYCKDSSIQCQTAEMARTFYTSIHTVTGCVHNIMNTTLVEVLNR